MKKIAFVLSVLAVSALFLWWFIWAATEPRPGHTYTRHVDCDEEYAVTARQDNMITFTNLKTKETKTITRDQWFRHGQ